MARFVISGIWKDKAIRDAVKSLKGLSKQTQEFSRVTASAYAAASAAAGYYAKKIAKESIQAALADEKSQRQLAFTLTEVAGANDAAALAAEANITAMSKMYGIADDELRPALARLVRTAGNTSDAFSGLDLALALSTATGTDLDSTVRALGKAYTGNFKSLKSLGLKIDEQKIKNKDLDGILGDLRKTYGDFAKNELNTTANQFNKLKTASDEAKESVGVALNEAILNIINSLGGIDKVVKRIEGIGVAIADTISGVGALVKIFKNFFAGLNSQAKALGTLGAVFLTAYKFGKLLTKLTPWRLFGAAVAYTLKVTKELGKQQRINAAIAAAADRQRISARNAEYVALKKLKQEEEDKGNLSEKTLEQLIAEEAARKAGFKITEDIDSIQTVAAAKRLAEAREYKMSILDAAQAQYEALKNNYDRLNAIWQTQTTAFNIFKALVEAGITIPVAMQLSGFGGKTGSSGGETFVPTPQPNLGGFEDPLSLSMGAGITNNNNAANINVTVNAGLVGDEQLLSDMIVRSLTQATRNGVSTIPAGLIQ